MTESLSANHILNSTTSLYEVLGVSDTADKSEIAKQYRQLSAKFHPDRLPQEVKNDEKLAHDSKRALQLVQDAYKTLTDDEKRTTYDFARRVGASQASQEQLQQLHTMMATNILFGATTGSNKTGGINGFNVSSSASASPPELRKCSCGQALANPDDLLCSSCSLFKPKGRCKQMGCLNDISASSSTIAKRTEQATGMCDKCAFRRKCSEWGCMKKVEAADRDVCAHHFANPSKSPGRPAKFDFELAQEKLVQDSYDKMKGCVNKNNTGQQNLSPADLIKLRMKMAEMEYQEQVARSAVQLQGLEIAIQMQLKCQILGASI